MMREQIKKLIFGNGLAQLIQFGAIFILSRMYLPSDFGVLAKVQSIAMIVSILLTLQLHLIIPLSANQTDALKAVKYIQMLSIGIFFLLFIPAVLFEKLASYATLYGIFLAFTNIYSAYLVYSGDFGKLSTFYIVRSLLVVGMQIGFAYFGFNDGLIIAALVGEALSAIYLNSRSNCSLKINWIPIVKLKLFILNNKQFSFYGVIQEIISVSAYYAPLFIFIAKFNEDVGGQYAMASRVVWAPVILISGSYAQVLFHRFGKTPPCSVVEINKVMPNIKIPIIAFALCVIALIFNEITLSLIGSNWELASLMIPIQGIWGVVFFMSTPYRVLIRVFRIQEIQLLIDFGIILAFLALFAIFDLTPVLLLCAMVFVVVLQQIFLFVAVASRMRDVLMSKRGGRC